MLTPNDLPSILMLLLKFLNQEFHNLQASQVIKPTHLPKPRCPSDANEHETSDGHCETEGPDLEPRQGELAVRWFPSLVFFASLLVGWVFVAF